MSNEELREQLEEKYNINLDIQSEIGEKTYWDLREYFIKEIKEDNLIIPSDNIHICCHRIDTESMKEEFNKQINEIIENELEPCDDPYLIGCRERQVIKLEEAPPPYK